MPRTAAATTYMARMAAVRSVLPVCLISLIGIAVYVAVARTMTSKLVMLADEAARQSMEDAARTAALALRNALARYEDAAQQAATLASEAMDTPRSANLAEQASLGWISGCGIASYGTVDMACPGSAVFLAPKNRSATPDEIERYAIRTGGPSLDMYYRMLLAQTGATRLALLSPALGTFRVVPLLNPTSGMPPRIEFGCIQDDVAIKNATSWTFSSEHATYVQHLRPDNSIAARLGMRASSLMASVRQQLPEYARKTYFVAQNGRVMSVAETGTGPGGEPGVGEYDERIAKIAVGVLQSRSRAQTDASLAADSGVLVGPDPAHKMLAAWRADDPSQLVVLVVDDANATASNSMLRAGMVSDCNINMIIVSLVLITVTIVASASSVAAALSAAARLVSFADMVVLKSDKLAAATTDGSAFGTCASPCTQPISKSAIFVIDVDGGEAQIAGIDTQRDTYMSLGIVVEPSARPRPPTGFSRAPVCTPESPTGSAPLGSRSQGSSPLPIPAPVLPSSADKRVSDSPCRLIPQTDMARPWSRSNSVAPTSSTDTSPAQVVSGQTPRPRTRRTRDSGAAADADAVHAAGTAITEVCDALHQMTHTSEIVRKSKAEMARRLEIASQYIPTRLFGAVGVVDYTTLVRETRRLTVALFAIAPDSQKRMCTRPSTQGAAAAAQADVVGLFVHIACAAVSARGGAVERFTRDGLVAVFGDPAAAVACAAGLVDDIRAGVLKTTDAGIKLPTDASADTDTDIGTDMAPRHAAKTRVSAVRARFGIASGDMCVASVGRRGVGAESGTTDAQLGAVVFGDVGELAETLAALNDRIGSAILVSEDVARTSGTPIREIGLLECPAAGAATVVYEAVTDSDPLHKIKTMSLDPAQFGYTDADDPRLRNTLPGLYPRSQIKQSDYALIRHRFVQLLRRGRLADALGEIRRIAECDVRVVETTISDEFDGMRHLDQAASIYNYKMHASGWHCMMVSVLRLGASTIIDSAAIGATLDAVRKSYGGFVAILDSVAGLDDLRAVGAAVSRLAAMDQAPSPLFDGLLSASARRCLELALAPRTHTSPTLDTPLVTLAY